MGDVLGKLVFSISFLHNLEFTCLQIRVYIYLMEWLSLAGRKQHSALACTI